jgi:hypothetical protein
VSGVVASLIVAASTGRVERRVVALPVAACGRVDCGCVERGGVVVDATGSTVIVSSAAASLLFDAASNCGADVERGIVVVAVVPASVVVVVSSAASLRLFAVSIGVSSAASLMKGCGWVEVVPRWRWRVVVASVVASPRAGRAHALPRGRRVR